MATHSSVLAWRIPGMGEPGGLPSMGSQSWTRLKRLSSSSSSSRSEGSVTGNLYMVEWINKVNYLLFLVPFLRTPYSVFIGM